MKALLIGLLAFAACAVLASRDAAATLIGLSVDPRLRLVDRPQQIEWVLAYNLMWALVTPFVFLLARRMPFRRQRWAGPLVFHLATGFTIAGVMPVVLAVLFGALVLGRGWPDSPGSLVTPFWLRLAGYRAIADVSMYWVVLGAGLGLAAYDGLREKRVQAAQLERSLANAQLDALRMNLQPHFLFNTLSSIAFLALEQDAGAIVMLVGRLRRLLQASVDANGRQTVPLADELALVDQYLAIEEVRFRDRLRVGRHVEPGLADVLVPSLMLQPIVENSIKHGFSRRIDASRLDIRAWADTDTLVCAVEDDGPGLPAGWSLETHCGRGLKNVLERLEMLYSCRWAFSLRNRAGGGAVAEVRIPLARRDGPAGLDGGAPARYNQ